MTHLQDDANFFLKVRMGLVPGVSIVHNYGFNSDVDTVSSETIWPKGGVYNFQAAAVEFYISSSDIADTTQSVQLKLLDADYKEVTQVVQLNGQTGVIVPGGPYIRGNFAQNVTQGEIPFIGSVSIGTEVTPAVGVPALANTVLFMRTEAQIGEQSVYTVPVGHTGYIFSFNGSAGKGKDAALSGAFREFGGTLKHTERLDIFEESSVKSLPFSKMPEKSDLMIIGTTEDVNAAMSSGFDIILVDNSMVKAV